MGKTVVTKDLFTAIKTLREAGSTVKEIATYLKISEATVGRAIKAESLDEYFNQCASERRAMYAKQRAKKELEKATEPVQVAEPAQVVEKRTTVTVQASHYMESELRKQTEVLELISRKLTATMEAVEALLEVWKSA